MGKSTIIWLAAVIVTIAIAVYIAAMYIMTCYQYDVHIGSYCDLAIQAFDVDKKASYLGLYAEKLWLYGLDSGQSEIYFPTPKTDLALNFQLLESFIDRLNQAKQMDKNSLEYQQFMI